MRPSLDDLARRLPSRFLTRYAPSPTGYLHLGHVVNAIYVWGLARALGGRVLLRMEDHDRQRCRKTHEQAILDDLDWLRLEPDVGPTPSFRGGPSPLRQSDCAAEYEEAVARLRTSACVFACDCSRRAIGQRAGTRVDVEPRYPGTCRARDLEPAPGRGLRLAIDPGDEPFTDAMQGPHAHDPSRQCGDLLIRDRVGQWTYQFAVTVDDCRQGVDLVVRGLDLLESTARQIRLARLLGRPDPPVFCHHGLLFRSDGTKLSKSNRDTGVRDLRARGMTGAAVLGRAAFEAGLQAEPWPIDAVGLPSLFDTTARR